MPKYYSKKRSDEIKLKELSERGVPAALADLGAAFSLGGLGALGGYAASKYYGLKKPLHILPPLFGFSSGNIAGLFSLEHRRNKYMRDKGYKMSRSGRLEKKASKAFTDLAILAPTIGAASGGFGGYMLGSDEKAFRNAAVGAMAGGLAGTAFSARELKKFQDYFGRNFSGRSSSKFSSEAYRKTSDPMNQAASDLNMTYRRGKFYTEDGSPITTKREVNRRYRRRSMETHPDRGGNPEDFKRVQDAFKNVIQDSDEWSKLAFLMKKAKDKKTRSYTLPGTLTGGSLGITYDMIRNARKGKALQGHPITLGILGGLTAGATIDLVNKYKEKRASFIRSHIREGSLNVPVTFRVRTKPVKLFNRKKIRPL